MKSLIIAPLLLVAFLAGPLTLPAQSSKEKKIDRIQRKIEKQSKKLQELTGEEFQAYAEIAPPMRSGEPEMISEEALAQAEEAREQVRESMEEQREALEEQREALRDQKRDMEKKMIIIREKNGQKLKQMREMELDKLNEWKEVEVDVLKDINGKKLHYYYKTPNWESKSGDAFIFGDKGDIKIDIPEFKGGVYSVFSGNQDNLSIDKNLSDESGTADFNYEVKEGVNRLSVNVNGAIDAGKVKITIKRPDGEVYNEYTLSPLANVNWKQTIKFEDQEESQFLGKWTVTVAAEKAKGTYTVQLNGR